MSITEPPDEPPPPGLGAPPDTPNHVTGRPDQSAGKPDEPAARPDQPGKDGGDPTDQSHWRGLKRLLDALDDEIARLYAERGIVGIKPRYTMVLIRLSRRGPLTIRQLAESLELTHSALSQTVSALREEGLVASRPGTDARTREITLTDRAREIIPFLEDEWRATEAAVVELEAEIPYPLSQVVRDIEHAVGRKSFHDRLLDHLDEHANGSVNPDAPPSPGNLDRPDGSERPSDRGPRS